MANTKSAKKDLRRSNKRRVSNIQTKSALKTYVKKARVTAAGGDADAAKTALTLAVKMLDKAAQKGVIHKNAAARRKSRVAKAANKAAAAAAAKAAAV
ncbi:MAG: 30S ribosomal protein S20 [Fimbriimonas sp.]